jgi:hypothetical protein
VKALLVSRQRLVVVVVLGLLCMAPTAGDIGGCGTEAKSLDPEGYAYARKRMDCQRCQECGINTARCQRSCDPNAAPDTAIPSTCQPLYHDGEVCIRVLSSASCSTYASYVDDLAPSTPSECEFCKIAPAVTGSFSDGAP